MCIIHTYIGCVYSCNNGDWREIKNSEDSPWLNLYFGRDPDQKKGNHHSWHEEEGWDTHLARVGKQAVLVSF